MLLPDVRPLYQSVDPSPGLGLANRSWALWDLQLSFLLVLTGTHRGLAPGRREPAFNAMLYAMPLAFWLYLNMSLEDSSVIL